MSQKSQKSRSARSRAPHSSGNPEGTGEAAAEHFDVVVLGAGAAGETAAAELARAGRTVALVENGLVGGERAYYACLPSKSLLASAHRGESWEVAVAWRDEVTRRLDDKSAADRLVEAGVVIVRGYGQVTGPGLMSVTAQLDDRVERRSLAFGDLLVCTGSEAALPPVEGLAGVPFWTPGQALTCPDLPRRLVVLGGDPVSCELAQVYAAFGSQVTLVEGAGTLLAPEAPFVGEVLAETLRRMAVDLRLGVQVVWAERIDTGIRLLLSDGGMIDADRILVSAGRRPRTSGLGLELLGVEPDATGALPVDATCRVVRASTAMAGAVGPGGAGSDGDGGGMSGAEDSGVTGEGGEGEALGGRGGDERAGEGGTEGWTGGVWAAGDVTGLVSSTHAAGYQARVAVSNLLGRYREADYRAIPRVVHTEPSVHAVGMSPVMAAELGIEPVIAGFDLCDSARAAVEDGDRGRVELYADPGEGVLIGGAAVGPHAQEWMSEITLAVRARIPLGMLIEVVHAFPTYGETIETPLRELAERP